MSFLAKMTFASSVIATTGIIATIFYKQKDDREKLHAGIVRDVQRQEERRFENMYILEQQRELTRKLRERERKMREDDEDAGD